MNKQIRRRVDVNGRDMKHPGMSPAFIGSFGLILTAEMILLVLLGGMVALTM